ALDYYQRALMLATEVRDLRSEAWITSKFGEIAQFHEDAGEAEYYYQKSLRMTREVQDRWLESRNLMNLGRLAQAARQLDSAERYYQEALSLEIARHKEDHIYYAELE